MKPYLVIVKFVQRIGCCWILLLSVSSSAQFPRVDIPGSEKRTITSAIVSGQEYELQILLPGSYRQDSRKYPVVYLMDSQWDFPLVKSIYGQQYYDGFIPELIIVGVTWAGVNPNPDSLRVRDYTPTKDGRIQSGGADRFLSFMKKELFPFIESNYRAEADNRSIMGCSLGGLITLYALFTQPDMFSGYAAASPAIGWGNNIIDQFEKKYFETHTSYKARLYMSFGEVERGLPRFSQLADYMGKRQYSSLQLKSAVLENTGHSGTKSETFGRGLQFIFEKPQLSLNEEVLKTYTGQYKAANGATVNISLENGGLLLQFSSANRFSLLAASSTQFYSKAEFLNLEMKTAANTVKGFLLNRYGSSVYYQKIN